MNKKTKAREIIERIESADECEIMEFDFSPCFDLLREMEDAMSEFIDRVDDRQVISTYTYNKFKHILGRNND